MLRASFAVASLLALAGCFGGDGGAPSPAPDHVPEDGGLIAEPTADTVNTPVLAQGDWWRWEVEGRYYGSFEVTTVVARVAPDSYTFASTNDAEAMPAHIFHVPPLGEVSRPDLQWLSHGHPMDFIRFPLFDGKTWTGSFDEQPVEFTAVAAERDGRAVFTVDGRFPEFGDQGPRFVYDPSLRMFSEVSLHYGGDVPFSSARVIASGRGHEGDVYIHEVRDKFLGGSSGVPEVPNPTGQFQATQEKEWLVFGCQLGGATGRFEILYVPPISNEDPLQCSFVNEGTATFEHDVQILWRSSVPGDWSIAFSVVGDGYAEAEVAGVLETVCRVGDRETEMPAC